MVWTKQQVGLVVGVTALALVSGGTAGFVLGSRHQKQSTGKAAQASPFPHENSTSVTETDNDEDETASGSVPSNGRHAGTRFLAARKEQPEAPKKETPAVSNVATNTNTNTTATAAAETGATPRSRRSRRTPF